ncbi:MAG: hypothetical protein IT345_12015 [Trueperaceae bacterium]|nr:hypothetical protein [Trueperaceae bacterium]
MRGAALDPDHPRLRSTEIGMEPDQEIEELVAFSRYLSWADLVRCAYAAECHKSGDGVAAEPVWGPSFAWLAYWYSSLFVVSEAYEKLGWRDRILDGLLAHPGGYKDLLRRFRNGVYHFQPDLTDSRLLDLLNSGEEHVFWIHALHTEFRRILQDRISAHVAPTSPARADVDKALRSLVPWPPQEAGALEGDPIVERARSIVGREPIPGMEGLHSDLARSLGGLEEAHQTCKESLERLRRKRLTQLDITVVDEAGG